LPCPPEKVEDLFHAAMACDPRQRDAFLLSQCASDPNLIAEVQSLIRAHEQSEGFLEPTSGTLMQWLDKDVQLVSSAGESIGRFKILSLLGKGGMGEVYLAEDSRLGRKVALKSLRSTSIGDLQAKKRLIREARAAATLDHPNICAIYEVDEQADLSFIVMQYIEGDTLSNKIRGERVSLA
jgi:serine/threonine protein kinase